MIEKFIFITLKLYNIYGKNYKRTLRKSTHFCLNSKEDFGEEGSLECFMFAITATPEICP